MPNFGQIVERIVEILGDVITSLVFEQIGCRKRLGSHFWTFWTHWSRFQKHLSIVNTYFYNFYHNREAQAIGSWTRRRSPGALGELLIKIVVFTCLPAIFSLTALVSMYFEILSIYCIK